jgi:ribosomal protein S18 acetylase RimI-like enzyme
MIAAWQHRRVTPSELEAAAARAWPAAEAVAEDGWLLRHTPAVGRRRSNSALPLGGSRPDGAAVEAVEAWYRARGAPAMVQVAPAEEHAELDGLLAGRGWTAGGATDVLVADAAGVAAGTPAGGVREGFTAGWLAAWAAVEGRPDADGHRGILAAVPAPAGFAAVHRDGRPLAVGLCAVEGARGGVFCLATAQAARRRGLARGVLAALAAWAAGRGAARLYLQVEAGNTPARDLFAGAGFVRSHGYHYRTAPLS